MGFKVGDSVGIEVQLPAKDIPGSGYPRVLTGNLIRVLVDGRPVQFVKNFDIHVAAHEVATISLVGYFNNDSKPFSLKGTVTITEYTEGEQDGQSIE